VAYFKVMALHSFLDTEEIISHYREQPVRNLKGVLQDAKSREVTQAKLILQIKISAVFGSAELTLLVFYILVLRI
jgi:hypothetical protein